MPVDRCPLDVIGVLLMIIYAMKIDKMSTDVICVHMMTLDEY
jgi:hypothetical protein